MHKLREEALKLRLLGYSYSEINKKLGIAKSTLSGWFSELVLSTVANKRIAGRVRQGLMNGLIKRNKAQTHIAQERARKIQKSAIDFIGGLNKREKLLMGAVLYWGEGHKKLIIKNGKERTWHMISFTNSDLKMVNFFIQFLIECMNIPLSKITASLRLYKHINEKAALQYWESGTDLTRSNFRKTTYQISRSSMGKRPFNRLPYGTIQVRVGDTSKFHQLMGWIEGIKKAAVAQW